MRSQDESLRLNEFRPVLPCSGGRTGRARKPGPGLPHLVIMAKAPRLGAVKTRLARDIGAVAALRFYRLTLKDTIRRLGRDPRWRTWVAITPDTVLRGPAWSQRLSIIPQGRGDLGRRMQRIFDRLPPGPAIIVGCDIPNLHAHHVADAFRRLGSAGFVFGPATDGGYWLVGAKRFRRTPGLFRNVRWSTEHALADTLRNVEGSRVAFAATLSDVDDDAAYAANSRPARAVVPIQTSSATEL